MLETYKVPSIYRVRMLRRVGNADYVCFFKIVFLHLLHAWSGEMQDARFVEVHARLKLQLSELLGLELGLDSQHFILLDCQTTLLLHH